MLTADDLIKNATIRVTTVRKLVLELLLKSKRPLSHGEISSHKKMTGLDKVTIYRTLEVLKKAKLIHRTLSSDGVWRFCSVHEIESSSNGCSGNHIHFFCGKCKEMSCMPEVKLPWITPPKGAEIHSKQLLVHGHCAKCTLRKKLK